MKVFQTKVNMLAGSSHKEVYIKARKIYKEIVKRTKRRPYIRSAYFKKEKIFLDYFWQHLHEKNWLDQFRRLQFYNAALDVIKNSTFDPIRVQNPNRSKGMFHRFYGRTKGKIEFIVQIDEDKRNHQKYFISTFPK
jgi:hypothetical protein